MSGIARDAGNAAGVGMRRCGQRERRTDATRRGGVSDALSAWHVMHCEGDMPGTQWVHGEDGVDGMYGVDGVGGAPALHALHGV